MGTPGSGRGASAGSKHKILFKAQGEDPQMMKKHGERPENVVRERQGQLFKGELLRH